MNELTGMVRRAALGAGWPQGAAEDLAAAAAALAAEGADWATHILMALDRAPGGEPAALDLAVAEGAAKAPAPDPTLFRGYAKSAERAYGCGLSMEIVDGIARLQKREEASISPDPPQRVEVAPTLWSSLAALAARTYVPASAASRAAGAGAGDIDNE